MIKKAIVCVDDENIILDSLGEQIENMFGGEFIYEYAENADEGMEVLEDMKSCIPILCQYPHYGIFFAMLHLKIL